MPRGATRFFAALLVLVALFGARAAVAQPSATDKAAAEALFQEGKRLFEAGDYEQACAKLTASQELDAGVGTLLYLGECFQRSGKTASAWATFKEAAGMARAQGQSEREQLARERAQALESRLSRLVVRGPEEIMRLAGIDVRLNGTSVPRATWGTPVPVDPGPQSIEVSAPGYEGWSVEVEVGGEGSETTVDIPALARLPEAKPETAPAPGQNDPVVSPGVSDASSSASSRRLVGYAAGGLGLAGLAVGSVFGLQAISDNNASRDLCRTETLCSREGLARREDARDAATISTIAFTAGAVLAASGVVLVLTAPRSPRTEASGSGSKRRGLLAGPRVELVPLSGPALSGGLLKGRF